MAKKIQDLDYRNILEVIKTLDVQPKRKVDGRNAATEAMLCGFAYIELIEMKNRGWFDSRRNDENRDQNEWNIQENKIYQTT